jgi:hypothetical protein
MRAESRERGHETDIYQQAPVGRGLGLTGFSASSPCPDLPALSLYNVSIDDLFSDLFSIQFGVYSLYHILTGYGFSAKMRDVTSPEPPLGGRKRSYSSAGSKVYYNQTRLNVK